MKRLILAALALLALWSPAAPVVAQQQAIQGEVQSDCATNGQTPPVGTYSFIGMLASGQLCVSLSGSTLTVTNAFALEATQLLNKADLDALVAAAANPAPTISVITSPTNTPTVSTSAYSTGFVLGGIQSFTSQPTTGVIANADVTFDSGSFSAGTVDLYIFNASPTGGGTTDHAAFALTSTDTAKVVGVMHLADCTSLGGVLAQCQALYQSQFYTMAAAGTTIFAVAVVRGTPTFAGASDVKFSLQVVK